MIKNKKNKKDKLTARSLNFLALSRTIGNGNSCELLELEGKLDQSLLREAVILTLNRHPRTLCQIKREWPFYYWVPKELNPENLPLTFHQLHGMNSEEEIISYLHQVVWEKVIDPCKEFPIQVHYYEVEGRSYLQVLSSHTASDARSGYRFCYDLCTSYTLLEQGEKLDEKNFPPLICPSMQDDDLFFKNFSLSKKLILTLKVLKTLLQDFLAVPSGLKSMNKKLWDRQQAIFSRNDLGEDLLQKLLTVAKEKSVTLHCLLTESIFKAGENRLKGDGTLKLMDTFTLRPFAQENCLDVYDFLMVPYSLRIDGRLPLPEQRQKTFSTLMQFKNGKVLQELIRQQIYAFSLNFLPQAIWPFLVRVMARFVLKTNIVLTNTGPLPYSLHSMGKVDVKEFYSFSACFPPGQLAIVFSTFRNRLRLMAVSDRETFPQGIDEFLDPLKNYLQSLV